MQRLAMVRPLNVLSQALDSEKHPPILLSHKVAAFMVAIYRTFHIPIIHRSAPRGAHVYQPLTLMSLFLSASTNCLAMSQHPSLVSVIPALRSSPSSWKYLLAEMAYAVAGVASATGVVVTTPPHLPGGGEMGMPFYNFF